MIFLMVWNMNLKICKMSPNNTRPDQEAKQQPLQVCPAAVSVCSLVYTTVIK